VLATVGPGEDDDPEPDEIPGDPDDVIVPEIMSTAEANPNVLEIDKSYIQQQVERVQREMAAKAARKK